MRLVGIVLLGQPRSERRRARARVVPAGWSAPIALLGARLRRRGARSPASRAPCCWPASRRSSSATPASTSAGVGPPRRDRVGQRRRSGSRSARSAAVLVRPARGRRAADDTWGCGYAAPTARMQYTARSFAEMLGRAPPAAAVPRARRVQGCPVASSRAAASSRPSATDPLTRDRCTSRSSRAGRMRFARLRWLQQGVLHVYLLYILRSRRCSALAWTSPAHGWVRRDDRVAGRLAAIVLAGGRAACPASSAVATSGRRADRRRRCSSLATAAGVAGAARALVVRRTESGFAAVGGAGRRVPNPRRRALGDVPAPDLRHRRPRRHLRPRLLGAARAPRQRPQAAPLLRRCSTAGMALARRRAQRDPLPRRLGGDGARRVPRSSPPRTTTRRCARSATSTSSRRASARCACSRCSRCSSAARGDLDASTAARRAARRRRRRRSSSSALVGFGLKAGIMPLHVWLPGAHANAPSHVSALMSGVLIKMGIYGLVRITSLSPRTRRCGGAASCSCSGVVSGVLGVAFAIGQHDLKRLLAYHSVENIGIICMGLGVALLGRALGAAGAGRARPRRARCCTCGTTACSRRSCSSAPARSCTRPHTREIDQLGGLAQAACRGPALAFLVGAVAICGLPPLNGFVSELLVYLGLFRARPLDGRAALARRRVRRRRRWRSSARSRSPASSRSSAPCSSAQPRSERGARRARGGAGDDRRRWRVLGAALRLHRPRPARSSRRCSTAPRRRGRPRWQARARSMARSRRSAASSRVGACARCAPSRSAPGSSRGRAPAPRRRRHLGLRLRRAVGAHAVHVVVVRRDARGSLRAGRCGRGVHAPGPRGAVPAPGRFHSDVPDVGARPACSSRGPHGRSRAASLVPLGPARERARLPRSTSSPRLVVLLVWHGDR